MYNYYLLILYFKPYLDNLYILIYINIINILFICYKYII